MSPAQVDRPAFEITAGSAPLPALTAADVVEIDVHEEVGHHGRCTVLLQNWDETRSTVRYGDHAPFAAGTAIGVALGYHADLAEVFTGVVTAVTAHFPERSRPVLRVEARSRSILLAHPPRSRQLADVTDGDVVAAVASDHGLRSQTDDGVTHAFVVSDRRSDWDLLTGRAARLGWVAYVRGENLVVRPPAAPDDPREIAYPRDVVELHLTEDLTAAVDGATGGGWDAAAGEAVRTEHAAAAAEIPTGDRDRHDAAVGAADWPLRETHDESPAITAADEADARAVGRQRDAALAHVHGRARLVGDATLRCDSWVEISGVGERLAGPHYLSAVRHRLAGSLSTEIQVGRPPALLPSTCPGAGTGLHLGVVEAIDDPASTNRVRVSLPWRTDAGDGVWARLATLDAGDGYGTVVVPAVGQEVVLGYVDGDPAHPVVLGSLHSGNAAPPLVVDADNHVRTQVTPGGHALTFDDGDAARVEIVTAGGSSVVLDDANGELVLTHGDSGNALTVSAAGIELTAAQGDIVLTSSAGSVAIDAVKIEGTASGPSKLASSATFDLSASGPLSLKGALITLN